MGNSFSIIVLRSISGEFLYIFLKGIKGGKFGKQDLIEIGVKHGLKESHLLLLSCNIKNFQQVSALIFALEGSFSTPPSLSLVEQR